MADAPVRPKPALKGFRGDLEGVRGIALIFILSTHLLEWPTGGFVGLDMFFVLSGFLITSLMLREHARTGAIDVPAFYRRRIRRLGPASVITLVVTTAVAFAVFFPARAIGVLWDAIWAFLLVSNWNYAFNDVDYFATWLPQSPLLHFWSLSVEEQFYLFWPWVVLGGIFLATSRRRGRRRLKHALVIIIVVITALSLAWSIYQSLTNPQVAYLSTLTRVWQITSGALLALAAPALHAIPRALRPILAWVGLAVIIVCTFVFHSGMPYPGYMALIPAAGTAAVIAAGVGGTGYLVLADNPVTRYLGKISYTTYLWHWPVFVYMATIFGKESWPYLLLSVPISFLIAVPLFHFVEDPIRRSKWLEPRSRRRRRRPAARRRLGIISAIVALAVAGGLVTAAVIVSNDEREPTEAAPSATPAVTPTPTRGPEDELQAETDRLTRQIEDALSATSWPDPVLAQLALPPAELYAPQWTDDECLGVTAENESDCLYGDPTAPKLAALVGDSAAISYMPGLEPALGALGYRIQVLANPQCPFATVDVSGTQGLDAAEGFAADCNDTREWVNERLIALEPDLILVTDGDVELEFLLDGADLSLDERADIWETGLTKSFAALSSLQDTAIILLPGPPRLVSVQECATRLSTPMDCTAKLHPTWQAQYLASSRAVESADSDAISLVDTSLWFCSAAGDCPPFAGDSLIRADLQHLTWEYAEDLTTILRLTALEYTAAR